MHPDWLEAGPFDASNSMVRFYAGGGRGELLDCIVKHLHSSEDPLFIRGEQGSGKTLLSLLLGHKLNHRFQVVHCQQADLTPAKLIHHLFAELCPLDANRLMANLAGEPAPDPLPQAITSQQLRTCVQERHANEKPVVLVLDSDTVLDEAMNTVLNQLSQMTQSAQPLIQSVVFEPSAETPHWLQDDFDPVPGQPQYALRRLTLNEVHGFLQHHMLLFDYSQQHLFTREMACFIADRSGGLVGEVNTIAREAWMLAGIHNDGPVAMKHLIAVTGAAKRDAEPVSRLKQGGALLGRIVRSGGFSLAIFVMSVVVLLGAWSLSS